MVYIEYSYILILINKKYSEWILLEKRIRLYNFSSLFVYKKGVYFIDYIIFLC